MTKTHNFCFNCGAPLAQPVAQRLLPKALSPRLRAVFDSLPGFPSVFHAQDVMDLIGIKSSSATQRFIEQCKALGLIEVIGTGKWRAYIKTLHQTPGGGLTPPEGLLE
jgi:hypothetical protein